MAVVIIIRHHSHIRRGWRTGSEEGGARHAVQQTCVRLQETKGTGDTPDPGRCAGWTLRWLGTCVRLHEIKGAGDTPDPGRCAGWGRCAGSGDVCAPPRNERSRGHPGPRTLRWLGTLRCARDRGHPAARVSAGRGLERRATAQAGALLHTERRAGRDKLGAGSSGAARAGPSSGEAHARGARFKRPRDRPLVLVVVRAHSLRDYWGAELKKGRARGAGVPLSAASVLACSQPGVHQMRHLVVGVRVGVGGWRAAVR